MNILAELWMPVVLASVLVFVASSIIHMVTPFHKNDFRKLPDEEGARKTIGALRILPGDYVLPRPDDRKQMGSPEFVAKLNEGPRLVLTVLPNGATHLGKMLGAWFLYIVVITCCAAIFARCLLAPGAHHHTVFHVVGAAAWLGYGGASSQASIWYGKSWAATVRSVVDGLIYAAISGETFGLMWPR